MFSNLPSLFFLWDVRIMYNSEILAFWLFVYAIFDYQESYTSEKVEEYGQFVTHKQSHIFISFPDIFFKTFFLILILWQKIYTLFVPKCIKENDLIFGNGGSIRLYVKIPFSWFFRYGKMISFFFHFAWN